MRYLTPIVLALAVASLALLARAASDDFDRLFGKEFTAAKSSRDPKAITKCAEKLVDAADGMREQPDLQAQLYFHAYDLAMMAPDAYIIGQQAMEALGLAQPDKKAQAIDKLLSVLRKEYQSAAGNTKAAAAASYVAELCDIGEEQAQHGELADAIKTYSQAAGPAASIGAKGQHTVVSRLAMLRKIDTDERKSQKSPDPKGNVELAIEMTIELNRPREAIRLQIATGDTGAMLALAAADLPTLSAPDCLKLGDWYSSQTEHRTDFGKVIALERAAASYGQYLSQHTLEDGERSKIKLAAQKANDDLTAARAVVSIAAGAATAKITVITPAEFGKTYMTTFPEAHNLAAGGKATASATALPQRPASLVFSGQRTVAGWHPGTSKATFTATWPEPPGGRYVLIFVRTTARDSLNWLEGTTLRINNEPPQPVVLKAGGEKVNTVNVVLVDLQRITLIRSLELNLNQVPRTELVAIEIHRTAVAAGAKE